MTMNELITRTLDLRSGTPDGKGAKLRQYFIKTWQLDEHLYTQLRSPEIFYHRGAPPAPYHLVLLSAHGGFLHPRAQHYP